MAITKFPKGIEIIKALARKLITRDQTGIKRIPTRMEAEGEAGAIAAQIQQATGLRPSQLDEAIKSEEQVLSILNDLEYRSALSKQKESLKEFTRKEDVYEKASILKNKAKTGNLEFDEILEQEFNKAFNKKKKIPETEAELKIRMERENKEAVARIKEKKANPFKDVEATGKKDPNWDPDPTGMASGGIAGQLHLNQGGRVPAFKGGVMKLLKAMGENSPLQAYRKYLASVKKRSQEGDFKSLAPELGAITGGGILVNRALTRKLNEISKQEREAFYANIEKEYREKYKDDPEMLEIMLRGLEKRKSEKSAKGFYQDGGRARFDKGGMNRRGFLKLMGGLAALPVVGKFFKFAKPAAKAVEAVKASDAAGMPAWFPKLVGKVMKEGEEVSGDLERVITHKAKLPNSKTDVYVTQDLTTGDTLVDIGMGKHGWSDGWNGQPVRMQLKKGEVIQEGQFKGKKSKDEFDIEEAEFTGDAESVNYEDSSFSKYGKQGSDFSEVEKYATGKVSKESKAQKQIWEADWDDSLPDYEDFAKGGLAGVLRL